MKFSVRAAALMLGFVWACGNGAGAASPDATVAAVTQVLNRSAADWNRGDLAAFMRSYEPSPNTVYVSSHTVIHGYANIQAHYATAHPGAMGVLTFSDLSVRPLGADYAVVVARWHLAMASGKKPSGLFTLVLHRSATGWGIITDHSP